MTPAEHDIMRSVEEHYWWYQALRQHVADWLRPTSSSFSVLDAGCGTGGMLSVLRNRFPSASLTGMDISAHALEIVRARQTGAELFEGSVQDLPFESERFDRVLSIDVLSSAGVDAAAALKEAHRVTRTGGRFIINVAAFDFLRGAHNEAVGDKYRYTMRQVRGLLQGAGFEVEHATYWNSALFPPIAFMRWMSRVRPRDEAPRSDFRPLPTTVNTGLRQLATTELKVSDRVPLPFGTSLFATAIKKA